MGFWVARPYLRSGETIVWRVAANRQQSASRAAGGRLFLTEKRLLFQPNRLDSVLRAAYWSVPIADIVDVDVAARQPALPLFGRAAALRNRLKVVQKDGDVDLFVVSNLERVVDRIAAAVASEGEHADAS
jgi:hypothetical protein